MKYLLVIGLTSFMLVGCATEPDDAVSPSKWEYHMEMLHLTDNQTATRLNELHNQGWILVSIVSKDGVSQYTFKRSKQ